MGWKFMYNLGYQDAIEGKDEQSDDQNYMDGYEDGEESTWEFGYV